MMLVCKILRTWETVKNMGQHSLAKHEM